MIRTVDGGLVWSTQSLPSGILSLNGVSCPAKVACEAAGEKGTYLTSSAVIIGTSRSNVKQWETQYSGKSGTNLTSISCATAAECEAGGGSSLVGGLLGTTDGGTNWSAQALPAGSPPIGGGCGIEACTAVSCPGAGHCEAVATARFIGTSTGGRTWVVQPIPDGMNELTAIGCGASGVCQVFGKAQNGTPEVYSTDDNGAKWSGMTLSSQVFTISSVSCVSSLTCIAVGIGNTFTGIALRTVNGGASWSVVPMPKGVGEVLGISCVKPATCEAVGYSSTLGGGPIIVRSSDLGVSWKIQSVPPSVGTLDTISCSTAASSAAGGSTGSDGAVVTTTNSGTKWSLHQIAGGVNEINDLDCASAKKCEATGTGETIAGLAFVMGSGNGGASWSFQDLPESGGDLFSGLSCPSTQTCFVIGVSVSGEFEGGNIVTVTSGAIVESVNGGGSWTAMTVPSTSGPMSGVDCPTPSDCFAVGIGRADGDGAMIFEILLGPAGSRLR